MPESTKNWCFTINNPSEADKPLEWECNFVIYQLETGESGVPHYQGYVEFAKQKRLSAVKKVNARAHWEERKGSQDQAIDYCTKEATRTDGPWEKGTKVKSKNGSTQGARTDIHTIHASIKNGMSYTDVLQTYPKAMTMTKGVRAVCDAFQTAYTPDDVRGIWYYGEPGTGKSRKAFEEHPNAFRKPQNKWFDGYEGQDTIIMDDVDKLGACLGHHMKIWTDRYPCSGEVKGGTVQLGHKRFIVTSNYSINDLWGDDPQMCAAIKRRFKVVQFPSEPLAKRRRLDPAPATEYQFDTSA